MRPYADWLPLAVAVSDDHAGGLETIRQGKGWQCRLD